MGNARSMDISLLNRVFHNSFLSLINPLCFNLKIHSSIDFRQMPLPIFGRSHKTPAEVVRNLKEALLSVERVNLFYVFLLIGIASELIFLPNRASLLS